MKYIVLICAIAILAGNAGATDYFMGHDTTGTGTYALVDSSYYVDTVTSQSASGTLDSGFIYLNYNTGTPDTASIIIYNIDSTFLDSTASFLVSAASRTAYIKPFIEGASITADTKYFLGFHLASEGSGGDTRYYVNTGLSQGAVKYKAGGQATIPPTITAPSPSTNYPLAVGAWYSDGGAPPAPSTRRKLILQK